MRVLIGCEESGYLRSEFRRHGHDAWSCDLLPAADGSQHHIQADIMEGIAGQWDLIICHPPCTYMAVSGNRWYGRDNPWHSKRVEAVVWTSLLWQHACEASEYVCFEQPVSVWKPPAGFVCKQTVQPWQFSVMESKATVLHLHNLPKLKPWITKKPDGVLETVWKMGPSKDRSRKRGHLPWLARPMAEQWSEVVD